MNSIGWEALGLGVVLLAAGIVGLLAAVRKMRRAEAGAGAPIVALGSVVVALVGLGAVVWSLNLSGNLGR